MAAAANSVWEQEGIGQSGGSGGRWGREGAGGGSVAPVAWKQNIV